VEIHVLQGEREMAQYNHSLGRFHLTGIPPAPRGVPQVEVTFDIDANGIVNVSAKDMATGTQQSITITGSTRLSKDEIDKMMKEAESHADEDKKQREAAEAKNRAEQLLYATDKMIKDLGDKVPSEDKLAVDNAMNEVRQALESDDPTRINQASEALQQASYKLSQMLYEQASAQSQAGDAGASGAPEEGASGGEDENVIDAEFKAE